MAEEKRRDPEDGFAYNFWELSTYYSGKKYNKKAIQAYWDEECVPIRSKTAGKAGKANTKEDKKASAATVKASKKQNKTKAKAERNSSEDATDKEEKPRKPKLKDMVPSGFCVCGESLIDFLPATTADGAPAYRGVPGGSPFNCCIAAQRLGLPVSLLGALSTDLFGEQLFGHLSKEGVDMELVLRLPSPSTLAFVCRSEGEGEKYAFFKENAADRSFTKAHVNRSMLGRRFRGVHMSLGAITLEHGPCAEAFALFFKMGGRQGALRSFDPNIRPNMIAGTGKEYSMSIERLLRQVDLAKTSDDDLEFLYGEGLELPTVAAKWLKLGPNLVVVTRGSKGAHAFVPQGDGKEPLLVAVSPPGEQPNTIDAEGKSAPVVDTVGAGDTFMGGLVMGCLGTPDTAPLLAQLVEKKPWDEAAVEHLRGVLERAATCAAITCSRMGADPPTHAEVQKAHAALAR